MSSWTVKAKKIAAGKWIRFDAANPQHTLTFVGEPEEVTKISQQGPTKGETYKQMSFPVLLDGEEKILEPNKSLLTQLIEEDEEEPIIGSELLIKCLNPEKKTQWKIRRIAKGKDQITAYESKKEPDIEPANTEPEDIAEDSQASKDREEFMAGVQEIRIKRAKK